MLQHNSVRWFSDAKHIVLHEIVPNRISFNKIVIDKTLSNVSVIMPYLESMKIRSINNAKL